MNNKEAIKELEMFKLFIGYDKESIMVIKMFKAIDLAIQWGKNEARRLDLIKQYEDAIEKDKGIGSNEIRLWTGALKALKGCEVSE